jgi:hypothetical protein
MINIDTREPSPLKPIEVLQIRCQVLAARGMMKLFKERCTSPLECSECACPVRAHQTHCELCGSARLKPYDPKTGGYSA